MVGHKNRRFGDTQFVVLLPGFSIKLFHRATPAHLQLTKQWKITLCWYCRCYIDWCSKYWYWIWYGGNATYPCPFWLIWKQSNASSELSNGFSSVSNWKEEQAISHITLKYPNCWNTSFMISKDYLIRIVQLTLKPTDHGW